MKWLLVAIGAVFALVASGVGARWWLIATRRSRMTAEATRTPDRGRRLPATAEAPLLGAMVLGITAIGLVLAMLIGPH